MARTKKLLKKCYDKDINDKNNNDDDLIYFGINVIIIFENLIKTHNFVQKVIICCIETYARSFTLVQKLKIRIDCVVNKKFHNIISEIDELYQNKCQNKCQDKT